MRNKELVNDIVKALLQINGENMDLGPYSPVEDRTPKTSDIPFDVRDLADFDAGDTRELFIKFQAPKGFVALVTHYGVFSDAQFADQVEFWPAIDGKRVYPYQGTPDLNKPERTPFKIALGVSSDLSESSLIAAPLVIKEGQTMTWSITNLAATSQTFGVRMKGVLRSVSNQPDVRFGG